jgi:hypothetical protein
MGKYQNTYSNRNLRVNPQRLHLMHYRESRQKSRTQPMKKAASK